MSKFMGPAHSSSDALLQHTSSPKSPKTSNDGFLSNRTRISGSLNSLGFIGRRDKDDLQITIPSRDRTNSVSSEKEKERERRPSIHLPDLKKGNSSHRATADKKKYLTRSVSELNTFNEVNNTTPTTQPTVETPKRTVTRRKGLIRGQIGKKRSELWKQSSSSTAMSSKSSDNLKPLSLHESVTSLSDLQKRINEQQSSIHQLKEQLETNIPEGEKSRLHESLMEQSTLLQALQMHMNIMRDQHKKGYLRMRIGALPEPGENIDDTKRFHKPESIRYWFYLNYPTLYCYENETDQNPVGQVPLPEDMKIYPSPTDKCSFFIESTSSFSLYEFIADTPEESDSWKASICKRAGVQLGKTVVAVEETSENNGNNTTRRDSVTSSAVLLKKVKSALKSRSSCLFPCRCTSLDDFTTWADVSPYFHSRVEQSAADLTRVHVITAGTIKDVLFWIIIHHPLKTPNTELQTLLLCSETCCSPLNLVEYVEQIWEYFEKRSFPPELGVAGVQKRMLLILKQWLTSPVYHSNVKEEIEARERLQRNCHQFVAVDKIDEINSINIISVLQIQSVATYQKSETYAPSTKLKLMSVDALEIAQQLTVKLSLMIGQIQGRELICSGTVKHTADHTHATATTITSTTTTTASGDQESPTISKLEDFNDKVTRWVITVVLQASNLKEQVNFYKKFSRIAKHLHDLRNYQSCSAIVDGLMDASIQCIQRLRDMLPPKYIERMRKYALNFSPINEYARYRTLNKECPCLPRIDIHLRDMKMVTEQPIVLENGKYVNFERMNVISAIVFDELNLLHPKTFDYSSQLNVDPSVQKLLETLSPLEYEELNQMSIAREPTRTAQAVLELELAERDEEIRKLQKQIQQMNNQSATIKKDLVQQLDLGALQSKDAISSITTEQISKLLDLLVATTAENAQLKAQRRV